MGAALHTVRCTNGTQNRGMIPYIPSDQMTPVVCKQNMRSEIATLPAVAAGAGAASQTEPDWQLPGRHCETASALRSSSARLVSIA